MNRLFVLALMGASVFAPQAASAADIFVPPPVEYVETAPDYSGWYIRGDVGYQFESKTDGDYAFYNIFPGVEGIDDYYRYDKLTLEDGATFGLGAGYRFNEIFRADATVDFFRADVSGRTNCPLMIRTDPAHNIGPFGECYYEDSTEADVWTIMANAYVDLPQFGLVTPYIGAGIGTAYVSYDTNNAQEVCPPCDPSYVRYSGTNEGADDWRFASSLMAGASIDLTQQLALDVGYRFTKIWEGDAWGYDAQDTEFGATGIQTRDNGFDVHAVRAGLRYSFF
jgi:opacity protein-like surface antigen